MIVYPLTKRERLTVQIVPMLAMALMTSLLCLRWIGSF